MTRVPRTVVPGFPMHVIQRGNNRTQTFVDAADYATYLRMLRASMRAAACSIHAYVLMPNHVHLLLTPLDASGPARMMRTQGASFVRYFNARHLRTGTLWEGRFRSTVLGSNDHLLACSRYIELNPVRAYLVARPDEYAWSSHRHNARGVADEMLTPHPLFTALGANPAQRRAAYRGMFESVNDDLFAVLRGASRGRYARERLEAPALDRR